ncbi:MAG TPA: helix-turn-helix transcriptional regulator [Geminicoccaceae bacterium]|nr:helix-turn-helix transcriptional regulator [Geminicoccaceae bacterium]
MARHENYMDGVRAQLVADPELNAAFQKELARLQLARQIAAARKRAGLSQAELAERIGTKQAGVARMERASTVGFTTTTLAKIAAATGSQLTVQLMPRPRRQKVA